MPSFGFRRVTDDARLALLENSTPIVYTQSTVNTSDYTQVTINFDSSIQVLFLKPHYYYLYKGVVYGKINEKSAELARLPIDTLYLIESENQESMKTIIEDYYRKHAGFLTRPF